MTKLMRPRNLVLGAASIAIAVVLLLFRPYVLISGLQSAGLYAAVALPMALILGIVGIVNLAHGEFLMVGAYLAYFFNTTMGVGPLAAIVPVVVLMVALAIGTYRVSIRKVLAAPELNQLLLTFGISMVLSQLVNLIATSQTRAVSMSYATASATVGTTSFGLFDFIYDLLAVVILIGLQLFLKRTRQGKAAVAVGQNPRGARIVGINVDRTYLLVFSIAIGILGVLGPVFLVRHSIFPTVGGAYTMKSFSLVAMAGIGNLGAILWCSLALGIAEAFIRSFQGYGDWSDIVFFAMIIIVILIRARRAK